MAQNYWKPLKGYEGKYEISILGELRRIDYKQPRILTQYYHKRKRKWFFKVTKDGKSSEIIVPQAMWNTFKGTIPKGYCVTHRNGIKSDNSLINLELTSRKDIGVKFGGTSRNIPVAKIDSNGEIVDVYRSTREAGKENYLSRQTISDRCNNKVKKAFAPDGYEYAFEDSEISMKHALDRIARWKEREWSK